MPLVLVRGLDGARIDCVILDLMLPDLDGLGVLARMRHAGIAVPVVVQTAHGGIDNVVSALGAGAIDFGSSRSAPKRLHVSLRSALNTSALEASSIASKRSRSGTLCFHHHEKPGHVERAAHCREGGHFDHPRADFQANPELPDD